MSQRKKPQSHGGQGKAAHQGEQRSTKKAHHLRVSFLSTLSIALDCNLMVHPSLFFSLDLLPEEIFGTEDVPKYIFSNSSTEEEDATPEQRTNHQLRRRIRHLEHNMQDITARCSAERERRMSLEALIGGKIFILV
jgi:hypothetical protein